jgi:hypothetical protein
MLPAVAGLGPLGGCASDRMATPAEAVPGVAPVRAVDAFTPGPSQRLLEVFDARLGERLGVERRVAQRIDDDGRWETTSSMGDGPPRGARHALLDDGSVALEWTRSVKDTDPDGPPRLYVFDPPLVMMPATLAPGERFSAASRMTERDPGDEARVVMSGRARHDVRAVQRGDEGWDERWDEAGEGGVAVVGSLRISVGPAEAVRETVRVFGGSAEGWEQLAELVDYSVRVLGIPFKRERTRAVPARAGDTAR